MTYNESLAELNIALGDTGNVTFSNEEKERALTKAWNDSYVAITVYDSSLTFASGTYDYNVPSGITTVTDILISPSNSTSDAPTGIDQGVYSVSDGVIRFRNNASYYTTTGYGFTVKGQYKLDPETDTLDTPALQEYVIALAGSNCIDLLKYKKANLFLKNDTSMSELIAVGREFKDDVRRLRTSLPRAFETM